MGSRLKQFSVGKVVIYECEPQKCGDILHIFFFSTKICPRKWGGKGYRRLGQQGLLCVCVCVCVCCVCVVCVCVVCVCVCERGREGVGGLGSTVCGTQP